eukprot:TRINITY_DN4165_c0_g1_i5.p1 TRINITY_DN4165_c0_g1~~TRINITY_DN4165_c0_g1_i5.p1  ORF type:complete len:364 (+),score=75.27 TRINITY_DN4165_c0_g1_i5:107-1198(+)
MYRVSSGEFYATVEEERSPDRSVMVHMFDRAPKRGFSLPLEMQRHLTAAHYTEVLQKCHASPWSRLDVALLNFCVELNTLREYGYYGPLKRYFARKIPTPFGGGDRRQTIDTDPTARILRLNEFSNEALRESTVTGRAAAYTKLLLIRLQEDGQHIIDMHNYNYQRSEILAFLSKIGWPEPFETLRLDVIAYLSELMAGVAEMTEMTGVARMARMASDESATKQDSTAQTTRASVRLPEHGNWEVDRRDSFHAWWRQVRKVCYGGCPKAMVLDLKTRFNLIIPTSIIHNLGQMMHALHQYLKIRPEHRPGHRVYDIRTKIEAARSVLGRMPELLELFQLQREQILTRDYSAFQARYLPILRRM